MTRWLSVAMLVVTACITGGASPQPGANPIAGSVSDTHGNRLNGVFVTAERAGASYRVTVFSDDGGQYRFPDLEAGTYTVMAHAGGFQANRQSNIVVKSGATAEVGFTLAAETRPEELFRQAVPGEWLASLPGTEKQKIAIGRNCSGCHHNLYQLMEHRFTREDWLKIVTTMEVTDAIGIVRPPGEVAENYVLERGQWRFGSREEIADYLAQVQGPGSPLPTIKFHPRPTGKATQAIITEYRIPREGAAPHDVQVDRDGNAWYNDFKANYLGKINPKTGEIKEFTMPGKPGTHPGSANMGIYPDSPDHHVYVSLRTQGQMVKFDPITEKIVVVWERSQMRTGLADMPFYRIDRNGIGLGGAGRVQLSTGRVLTRTEYKGNTTGYAGDVDSKGVGYRGGISDHDIKVLNPETGEVKSYPTPTPFSGPRRSEMDGDETLWFGEWWGGKIGTFDTQTTKITEYTPSVPYAAFYQAGVNGRTHEGWSFDWHNDRLVRVNPRTGELTEYPMPTRDVESRRTAVDNSTNPPSVWIHGAGNGLIIRVQAP